MSKYDFRASDIYLPGTDIPYNRLEMADIAYDVLLETGIRIQPLPIWEAQWAHPEQYSNPYLLRNIAREGNLAMSAREWMGKAEFWYPGSAWIPRFPALPDSPGRAGKAGVQVEPGHQKTAEKAVWTCAQAAIFVQAVRDYFENKQ